jgi:alginate O-acetyltransferase complex protein AlgI
VLFTSGAYLLLFLPATVAVYWVVPARARVPVLLVASYVFYLSWHPIYGLLLAASTVVNFFLARRIPVARSPRAMLAAGVAFNLTVLGFFKYAGLLTRSGAQLASWLGLAHTGSYDGLSVLLPLAISFFTFEMISVLVDAYRGDVRVGGFLTFATYKAYFPKLISGPITRYRELGPQLEAPAPLSFDRFQSGIALFTFGLFKKLAIADNMAPVANQLFNSPKTASSGTALAGILAFGIQIYFDFSAYTDMARGASRLLGLELPPNFRFPYGAGSPIEFWHRWHMTLSRWLRDYLYIPLGGNRRGRVRTYVNLMVTMVLGGLWHGAAWHFALWGALQGSFLTVAHGLKGRVTNVGRALRLLGWVTTLVCVFGAWVFFRAQNVTDAIDVFKALGKLPLDLSAPTALGHNISVRVVVAFAAVILIGSRFAPPLIARARTWLVTHPIVRPPAYAAAAIGLWTAADLLTRASITPFIYFRF